MATISDSAKIGAATARRHAEAEKVEQQNTTRAIRGKIVVSNTSNYSSEWERGSTTDLSVKGGPIIFWLVAGIAMIKDIMDICVGLIDGLGIALSATVVGAPVGIPLTVFAEILDKVGGLFIDFTLLAYFGYIGGGFALRLTILSIGAIIDAIPFMNILPFTTITFFAAYFFGKVAKIAIQSSSMAQRVTKVSNATLRTVK